MLFFLRFSLKTLATANMYTSEGGGMFLTLSSHKQLTKENLPEHASLESVMAHYIECIERGEEANPESYLDKFPDHASELKTFFRNHHWLDESDPEESPLAGKMVGSYQIEVELARGGMGVVYRARQQGLDRAVALKLISTGRLAGSEERQRFRIEAEATAGLQHPCIIPIYEVGSWEGNEFFSMPLIEGTTLQNYVTEDRLTDEQIAKTVLQITEAVAYAHQSGIIHRDLKPENILINHDGHPLLTDFGLAKWHRNGTTLTRTGQVLGSPHYMSPEQASGVTDATESTDIYSLGAILYALLTGSPPHPGNNMAEVLRSVLQDEPIRPRSIQRDISIELEKICLKAMSHNPGDRYLSANDLAEDLRRYIAGDPTIASNSGLMDRVARELRRDQHQRHFKKWGASLIAIGVIVCLSHLVMFLLNQWENPTWLSFWLPRAIMLAMITAVIIYARNGSLLPRSAAERPVYSIWIAYLLTLATVNLLAEISGQNAYNMFVIAAALSGFGFIAMSGHVWGGSALYGVAFLLVAIVSHFAPTYSPLLLGFTWLMSLSSLAIHYNRRDRRSIDPPTNTHSGGKI
jgi:serine/threonine protein kinase